MTVNTPTTYHHAASPVEQNGTIDQKSIPSAKLSIAKKEDQRNPFLLYLLFSLSFLVLSCNPDRPNFEPSYSGAPPEEDLDQYLDAKAIFEGLDQVKGVRHQLDSLLTLTDKLKNYDDDVALVYADTAYSMATEKNWQLSRGIASYYIALLKGREEHYGERIEDALVDAKISENIFEELNSSIWLIRINNLIGLFHERKNDLETALEYMDKAIRIVESGLVPSQDSLLLKGEIYHDIANIHKVQDTVLAQKYYNAGFDIYSQTGNYQGLARLEFDWALFHYLKKDYDQAEQLMAHGLDYAIKNKDVNAIVAGYQRLGRLRFKQYSSSGEEKYAQDALECYRKLFALQKENHYFLYDQIGSVYQQKAFTSNDEIEVYAFVDSAIVAYRSAMIEGRKEGVLSIMEKMGRNISKLCSWRARVLEKDCSDLLQMNSADFLNSNYAGLTDTIGHVLQLANQRNSESARRELEIKNEQRSKVQWLISGSSLLIVGMIFIVLLQRQQQKRLKAKMEALRAQINPHFISNSLNAIESLVNLNKKEEAAKYLIHFSRLSRRILNSSREGNASLAEEIQTLEHFLALEQLRFRDKLQYLIDIDEDLNPKEIEMPAMLLQPYVENAIWHGIKPKAGTGLVKVKVEREGKFLICVVKDNGIGRTKSAEIKSASVLQQKSVAMKINQERLNVVGRAKGAKVDITDLYDENGAACGTKVTIRLPYKSITSR